jgi:hypothetical protein
VLARALSSKPSTAKKKKPVVMEEWRAGRRGVLVSELVNYVERTRKSSWEE